jgi:hypothetical protein
MTEELALARAKKEAKHWVSSHLDQGYTITDLVKIIMLTPLMEKDPFENLRNIEIRKRLSVLVKSLKKK